jgi:hypothetical protein
VPHAIPFSRRPPVVFVRSLIFQILFYLNLTLHIIASIPTFILPWPVMVEIARSWGRTSVWLLKVVCGISANVSQADWCFAAISRGPSGTRSRPRSTSPPGTRSH